MEQVNDSKREERKEDPILKLQKQVRDYMNRTWGATSDPKDEQHIREAVDAVLSEYTKEQHMRITDRANLRNTLFDAMHGLDVLQPLIDDPDVTEIMVNGPKNIFIERKGELFKTPVCFDSEARLMHVINEITTAVNRPATPADPIIDARLADGSRVNVVVPPISLNGPTVTIRKFPKDPFTMAELVSRGSITEEVNELLQRMIQAKYNIFISGGTGSGKTTFLNALSNYIPSKERIITIEDSAELQIHGVDNLVRMETRNANAEGKGGVSIRDCIRSSLRMRPERIIVGEVRGAEALDMLQAMNTGHDGSLSTGHANSAHDMLSRLETMVLTGTDMPLEAIRQQIASAVDIIIQLSRLRDHTRRTVEITEVIGYKRSENAHAPGEILLNPLYTFQERGEDARGRIIGRLERTQNRMANTQKFLLAGVSDRV